MLKLKTYTIDLYDIQYTYNLFFPILYLKQLHHVQRSFVQYNLLAAIGDGISFYKIIKIAKFNTTRNCFKHWNILLLKKLFLLL